MAYMQVRDVLKRASAYHARLAEAYRWISERTQDERRSGLLDYMAEQEETTRKMIDAYVRNSGSQALETWLHFIPPTVMNLQDLPTPDMGLDELVGAAKRLDRSLMEMYKRLGSYTSAPGTQEAFERLLAIQEEKEQKLSRAAFFENDFE